MLHVEAQDQEPSGIIPPREIVPSQNICAERAIRNQSRCVGGIIRGMRHEKLSADDHQMENERQRECRSRQPLKLRATPPANRATRPAQPLRTAAPAQSGEPAAAVSATDRGLRIVQKEMRCRRRRGIRRARSATAAHASSGRNPARAQPEHSSQSAVGDEDERSARQPRLALRREDNPQEALLVFQIPDQQTRS